MEDRITLIANLELLDDKLSELQQVVIDLQNHCKKTEEGMLQYDWYKAEDSNSIKVLETYVNSEAVLFHFDNYKPFTSRLNEYRAFVSLEIYGNASDELKERVKKINAIHYNSISYLNKLK